MSDHEEAFKQWKEETRREALEKELSRLQKENITKNRYLKKMKTGLFSVTALLILSCIFILTQYNPSNPRQKPHEKAKLNQEKITHKTPLGSELSSNIDQLILITPVSDTIRFRIPDDGIFFSVQVGAYMGIDMDKFKQNMVSLRQIDYDDINQFTLGIFTSYEEAVEFRDLVKQIGFQEAYITAMQGEKRINIREALQQRTKK
ncbi:hypothetical protein ACT29H_06155 [Thermophagus sp. OGC60D27]|uniref:hypothetical protein n=1 Tax=Thermophagus sp. OGC60D27 TaxID=3458415 RepID=UPI0040383243